MCQTTTDSGATTYIHVFYGLSPLEAAARRWGWLGLSIHPDLQYTYLGGESSFPFIITCSAALLPASTISMFAAAIWDTQRHGRDTPTHSTLLGKREEGGVKENRERGGFDGYCCSKKSLMPIVVNKSTVWCNERICVIRKCKGYIERESCCEGERKKRAKEKKHPPRGEEEGKQFRVPLFL